MNDWFRVGLAKAASVPALQEFIRPWRAMSYTFAVPRQSFAVANFLPLMENDFPRGVILDPLPVQAIQARSELPSLNP